MPLYIAVVKEAQYPELRKLCARHVVGTSFKHYMDMVAALRAEAGALAVVAKNIRIDPAAFGQWLGHRKAHRTDLFQFAAHCQDSAMALAQSRNAGESAGVLRQDYHGHGAAGSQPSI